METYKRISFFLIFHVVAVCSDKRRKLSGAGCGAARPRPAPPEAEIKTPNDTFGQRPAFKHQYAYNSLVTRTLLLQPVLMSARGGLVTGGAGKRFICSTNRNSSVIEHVFIIRFSRNMSNACIRPIYRTEALPPRVMTALDRPSQFNLI